MPDMDGQACTVLSHLHLIDRNFEAALASGREAVSNRPSCTHANAFYANVLHYCCEHESALHYIKLAMNYSPWHPIFYEDILAFVYHALEDLDQAEAVANSAIAKDSNDLVARLVLVSLAVKKKAPDKWQSLAKEVCKLDPAFLIAQFGETQPYRDQAFLKDLLEDLRDAGLPD